MAEQLIESLSTDFEPAAYQDEYREQLLALIERKAEGKEIVASDAEAPKATKTPDLMAALEETIAAVQGKSGRQETGRNQNRGKKPAQGEKTPPNAAKKSPAKKATRAKSKRNRPAPWPPAARSRSKAVS